MTDRRIHHSLPFLRPKTILYVAGADSAALDARVAQRGPELREAFEDIGWHFLYLPELLASIPEDVLDYLFPLQESPDAAGVYARIRETAGTGDGAGLLYMRHGNVWFRLLTNADSLQKEVGGLIRQLDESAGIRFRMEGILTETIRSVNHKKGSAIEEMFDREMEPGEGGGGGDFDFDIELPDFGSCGAPAPARTPAPPPIVPEEPPDSRTLAILTEIDRITESFGITVEELEVLLGYRIKLSRLQISRNGRILLADFGREVKMNLLSKAVYFLYLRHPEGIRFKEMSDHREELLDIYLGLTGRDARDEIERTVDALVDPLENGLNVCASRIKAAFRNQVGEHVARFYCLEGAAGEAKKVPLDRDFVIWEY
ncbi:MAG: hypothetical protein IKX28_07820 [Bacteroidales bacterium]|nr:hypothetical protein [Bacteroidales bacterium]